MGADMADINNTMGYPEIFVTEMLPEQESRIKMNTTFENWDKISTGYAAMVIIYQFTPQYASIE
jgi:hypothetical protein